MSTQRLWAGISIVSGIALALALCPSSARAAGELVLSFNPDMQVPPVALAATSDGGFLASVNGRIEKFRADGGRASDFQSALDPSPSYRPTLIVPDGKGNWFIGGWVVVNNTLFNLAKVRANGGLASEFEPIVDTRPIQIHASTISAFCSDGLGGGYIAGTFTELNRVAAPGLAHVDDTGSVTSISRPPHLSIESPKYLAVVPRGLLVVQEKDAFILTGGGGVIPLEPPSLGSWWSISSATYDPRFGIAMSVVYWEAGNSYNEWIFAWDADGRLDPSFKQSVEFGQPFLPTMKWDSAGRLIGINARVGARTAAGDFIDDGSTWGMKRLIRDGSLDPTWSRTLHFDLGQGAFCELTNGDLLVSGAFTKASGHNRTKVVRLMGSNDSTFSAVQQSTRGWVEGNREFLILGLVIPDRGRTVDVLIRAMSSSLRNYGVNDTVFATQFSVYRGQTLVTTVTPNDPRNLVTDFVGSRTGAFPAIGGNESKAVVSLEPGAYTVVISAIGGEKGEVLGEIYFPN